MPEMFKYKISYCNIIHIESLVQLLKSRSYFHTGYWHIRFAYFILCAFIFHAYMQNPFNSGPFSVIIDPPREITSRVWHRRPGQRLVRVSPIPEPTPVGSVNYSSLSDSDSDSDLAEMGDNTPNETGFSEAQIRTIAQIVAAALAQDRAQNQTPPASSS